ncbi:snare protein, partial [Aspergillus sclerotialis]
TDRDEIDTSTTLLLRSLSTSISNLSSAESLRQETESSLLRKKYGVSASNILFRWAGGAGALSSDRDDNKSVEQARDEEVSRVRKTVRESVLWYLRRGLESAAERQRELVERRIERVREKERSALYKASGSATVAAAAVPGGEMMREEYEYRPEKQPLSMATGRAYDTAMSSSEAAEIESQLSAEQLQLFAEENDSMLRYYEDTLGKVQNAEKSLLEISSLQQTLVSHLATQEEYIGQLVTDAGTTQTNIGEGNKELKRATEQRSTAQAVFWGTVGICTWLVVWDLIF